MKLKKHRKAVHARRGKSAAASVVKLKRQNGRTRLVRKRKLTNEDVQKVMANFP